MSTFLLYLLKSTLLLAVFDAYFLLVLRRDGHFRFNRITLLIGSVVCLLLPLIPVRVTRPTVYSLWLDPAVAGTGRQIPVAPEAATGGVPVSWQSIILILYALGAAVTLFYYVRSYGAMFRLLRRVPSQQREGFTLHLVTQEMPSFSWMRHIVINQDDYARYPAILWHEQAHVRRGHSVDLLLSTALTVFQWFNPLVWIGRSELKLIHEYEADDFVLNQGIDATQYQLLLVKKAVGEKRFLLANGFNHAQLKNRIAMMQNSQRKAWKKYSLLLLLPLLAGTMLLLAECKPASGEDHPVVEENALGSTYSVTVTDEPEAVPFTLVEIKPKFQESDANQFARWVNEQLPYPEEAREKKLQGRVTLQFVVEKDGNVTGVKVLRGIDPILDEEAVRVVSLSPKWTPGYINGEPVRIIYNFPVVFQLK